MAHTTLPALFFPEFPQLFDGLIERVCRVVDPGQPQIEACRDSACPVVGAHNTDECRDLIAEANGEVTR